MLSNYEPRTRSRNQTISSPLGRFIGTLHGFKEVYDYSVCSQYDPWFQWRAYRACKANVQPTLEAGSFSPGYVLNHSPDYKYSQISDYIGVEIEKVVKKKFVWYTYPDKRCRYYHRMDPKGSMALKCRVKHVTYRDYTIKGRYKPADGHQDMKPVTHVKTEFWKMGTVIPVKTHNDLIQISSITVTPKFGEKPELGEFTRFPRSTYEYFGKPGSPKLPTAELEIVDIYRSIAKDLSKIGGFTFETEANLLVNLIEVKELLALFSVASYAGGPLVRVASLYLAYQFGIAPTLADFETVLTLDKKVKRAVDKWNKVAGKVTYYHFRTRSVHKVYTDTRQYYDRKIDTKERMNATLAIVGQHLTYPSFTDRLRQYGFDKPMSAMWELIPFSFVLDWFTDIGGFISSFETKASPARFRIVDACYSHKFKGITITKDTNAYSYLREDPVVHEISYYKRRYLNVDYLNSPQFAKEQGGWRPTNRFGTKQLVLSGALAVVLTPALRR